MPPGTAPASKREIKWGVEVSCMAPAKSIVPVTWNLKGGQVLLYSGAMLIDSHCHIDDVRFDADREAMMARARAAGVEHFVTIGCDLETSRAAVSLAQQHPFIAATVGVHPHEVKRIEINWYDEIRSLAKSKGVVAYGEIGLDYHYDHSPREVQRQRFREQVHLARELGLPIVIHTRDAQEDTITSRKEA